MIPETALIYTEDISYNLNLRICGLYPLERNIRILTQAGIKKIYLDLTANEELFFTENIKKHLKNITSEIITGKNLIKSRHLKISSNLYLQAHYFKELHNYFRKDRNKFLPIYSDTMFLMKTENDFNSAVFLTKKTILDNTGGFIARKLNKRISIPVSSRLANTRIHPNYLTIFNMLIGFLSGIAILYDTYLFILLGGFLFQLASILDGVDGEVAKFTLKTSKAGAWLDTISDNSALLFFIAACSYIFYKHTGGLVSVIFICLAFTGILTVIIAMVRYLKRYSESGSLVAYDKEFFQNLPKTDMLVRIVIKLKFAVKKDFFSIVIFLFCIFGLSYLIIPVFVLIIVVFAVICVIFDVKYLKNFGNIKKMMI
jgi:phosphatidylglycerophosphate synthase